MTKFIIINLITFIFKPYQALAVQESGQFWNDFVLEKELSRDWSLQVFTSFRHQIEGRAPFQYILPRFLLEHKIQPQHDLAFSWENFLNPMNNDFSYIQYEARNFLQHTWKDPIFFLSTLRTRFELRKFDGEDHIRVRLRFLFGFPVIPIDDRSRIITENEYLMHLNNQQATRTGEFIDAIRLAIAWDKDVTEEWSLRAGYMNQYQPRFADDRMSHILRITLTYSW